MYYLLTRENLLADNEPDAYSEIFTVLKENGMSTGKIKKYLRKPSKLEINETDAFIVLIRAYPIDFGLKGLDTIRLQEFWNAYRNHLLHTCFIGGEAVITECLQTYSIHPQFSHLPDVPFRETRNEKFHDKTFYFTEKKRNYEANSYKNFKLTMTY